MSNQQEWQPPETAPKDKTFLGDFGYPWPLMTCWNPSGDNWAYAQVATGLYLGKEDPYFETEWEKPSGLKSWCELPEIER